MFEKVRTPESPPRSEVCLKLFVSVSLLVIIRHFDDRVYFVSLFT